MPRPSRIIAAALALVLLASVPVSAATRPVAMRSTAFDPRIARIVPGDVVRWTNADPVPHTTTRRHRVASWNAQLDPGESFGRRFTAAGTYGYVCLFHDGMTGTVSVAMIASPSMGTTATTFRLTWASIVAPSGQRYQVQRRAPGAVAWVLWRTTVARTGTFRTSATGTWQYRARLQRLVAGTWLSGAWSPIRRVVVSDP